MRRRRRFSEAISEGDGISVIVDVHDADGARRAEAEGAEALSVRGLPPGVREASGLPICWRGSDELADVERWGADACLLSMERLGDDDGELEAYARDAVELGFDYVVEVRSADELEAALERVDPEILLLSSRGSEEHGLEWALELLADVPAGKLAVAEASVATRGEVVELERAGVDAVIVGARNVAELVGGTPPEV